MTIKEIEEAVQGIQTSIDYIKELSERKEGVDWQEIADSFDSISDDASRIMFAISDEHKDG